MIQESIVKVCTGNISKWLDIVAHTFWADRAMTCKSMGHMPFFMAHGVEPILPFDIMLATFLVPNLVPPLTTTDLLAACAQQLEQRRDDLTAILNNILCSRFLSVKQFKCMYANTIRDFNFEIGSLILVHNSSIETDLACKTKPRYIGLMIVLRRTTRGAYRLVELDGTVSQLCFTAFRLVPYYSRIQHNTQLSRLVDPTDLNQVHRNKAKVDPGVRDMSPEDPQVAAANFFHFADRLTEDGQDFDPQADITIARREARINADQHVWSARRISDLPRTGCVSNEACQHMSRFFLSYYLAYGLMLSFRTFHLVSLSQRLNPYSSY